MDNRKDIDLFLTLDLNEISKYKGLIATLLRDGDKDDRQRIFEKLDSKLKEIFVNFDSFDIFDNKLYLEIFERLGCEHVNTFITHSYYLMEIISSLPANERFKFISKYVGHDKIRGLIFSDEHVKKFFELMPPESHDALKKILFLYDVKINCHGSKSKLTRPNQEKDIFS